MDPANISKQLINLFIRSSGTTGGLAELQPRHEWKTIMYELQMFSIIFQDMQWIFNPNMIHIMLLLSFKTFHLFWPFP